MKGESGDVFILSFEFFQSFLATRVLVESCSSHGVVMIINSGGLRVVDAWRAGQH